MPIIGIDYEKCINCGLCVRECPRRFQKDKESFSNTIIKSASVMHSLNFLPLISHVNLNPGSDNFESTVSFICSYILFSLSNIIDPAFFFVNLKDYIINILL